MSATMLRRFRYAGASAWLVLAVNLAGPPRWTQDGYNVILAVLPRHVWAAMFFVIGAAQAFELLTRERPGPIVAGAGIAAMWSVSFIASLLVAGIGLGYFALYGYLAVTQAAVAGAPLVIRRRLRTRARAAIRRSRRLAAE